MTDPATVVAAVPTGTERAVFGDDVTAEDIHALLNAYARQRLGSEIARVRLRAGRIDVVWGVDLVDGRAVAIKVHRSPADLDALRVTGEAQQLLAEAGFPCPAPQCDPQLVDGYIVTAESLITGSAPDGREPAIRKVLAEGLAWHIEILQGCPGLVDRAGPGPSWCHYQSGPWPVPHDPLVDFGTTVAGYEWLDQFGRREADQILANRESAPVVAGHADWYAGNTVVIDGKLTGVFDWELVADTEAVIAGFAAACFAQRQTSAGNLSGPEEVAAFMRDYDNARAEPLTHAERRAAVGAAAWICAFTARWQVALLEHNLSDDYPHVNRVQQRHNDYLSLVW